MSFLYDSVHQIRYCASCKALLGPSIESIMRHLKKEHNFTTTELAAFKENFEHPRFPLRTSKESLKAFVDSQTKPLPPLLWGPRDSGYQCPYCTHCTTNRNGMTEHLRTHPENSRNQHHDLPLIPLHCYFKNQKNWFPVTNQPNPICLEASPALSIQADMHPNKDNPFQNNQHTTAGYLGLGLTWSTSAEERAEKLRQAAETQEKQEETVQSGQVIKSESGQVMEEDDSGDESSTDERGTEYEGSLSPIDDENKAKLDHEDEAKSENRPSEPLRTGFFDNVQWD